MAAEKRAHSVVNSWRAERSRTEPTVEAASIFSRSAAVAAEQLDDLLHFLDPPADQWELDLSRWRTDHGAPYPFADVQAWQDFQDQWAVDHPSQPVPDTVSLSRLKHTACG